MIAEIAWFDQTAAIFVCNGERNLERAQKLPRGGGGGTMGPLVVFQSHEKIGGLNKALEMQ